MKRLRTIHLADSSTDTQRVCRKNEAVLLKCLRRLALASIIVLQAGCAHSSVKLRDTLGKSTAKGFVEFYIGTSSAKLKILPPEVVFDVTCVNQQGSQPCGEASGNMLGGRRLRLACIPGANEYILTPRYKDGASFSKWVKCDNSAKRVKVHVEEGMVTPVRIMATLLSAEVTSERLAMPFRISDTTKQVAREVYHFDFDVDVAAGEPRQCYDLALMNYTFDESFSLRDLGRVGKVYIEGPELHNVKTTKLRVDQAREGLNIISLPRDREEFVRRYFKDSPNEHAPQGIMVRILLIERNYSEWNMITLE
jgi:hypothetical protein